MHEESEILKSLKHSLEQVRKRNVQKFWNDMDDIYDFVAGTYAERPSWLDVPPAPGSEADIWFNGPPETRKDPE